MWQAVQQLMGAPASERLGICPKHGFVADTSKKRSLKGLCATTTQTDRLKNP